MSTLKVEKTIVIIKISLKFCEVISSQSNLQKNVYTILFKLGQIQCF